MKSADIIFIGYENLENLGLRSMISYLHSKNFSAELVAFQPGHKYEILKAIKKKSPSIVGFSLIFQYTLHEFKELIRYLRKNSIHSHFTAGGHFPSIEPALTFELIPELDSIVRFEGEQTIVDLVNNLSDTDKWQEIAGLAYKTGSGIKINDNRPLIEDLDSLPFLFRDEHLETIAGIKTASMLASRGCLNNCSFCSIRRFYGNSGGPLRRVRSPQSVVSEMSDLYHQNNVCYFLFQDDDFANRSTSQRIWIMKFLEEIEKQNLSKNIRWKISCRVDDIDRETFSRMKDHGLSYVYLGIESGNSTGLQTLNKGVTVEQNLKAISILKELGIGIFIGFMLFDPSTTDLTIRENLAFLRTIGSDGYFSIDFCKMLPYAGTPIEKVLRESGRLTGTLAEPDYDFTGPEMNIYFYLVQKIFSYRNFNNEGIVNSLIILEFEFRLIKEFYPDFPIIEFQKELSGLIARTNIHAIDTLEKLLDIAYAMELHHSSENGNEAIELAETEWKVEFEIKAAIENLKNRYMSDFNAKASLSDHLWHVR
jgi:radical SAM superfamily enzyme YgiQ (UPF0313 family)